ncbi:MAG TPA: EF-hand domain-containing protein [Burkholderiales bacterium]|jgi:hypothetical protein
MTQYKPWVLAFSLLAFATASAYANDASKKSAPSGSTSSSTQALDFSKADTNHDGKLSRQEFDAAVKGAGSAKGASGASGGSAASASSRWDFGKADTNHDGSLSRQEFDAMMKTSGSSAASGSTTPSTPSGAKSNSSSGTKSKY